MGPFLAALAVSLSFAAADEPPSGGAGAVLGREGPDRVVVFLVLPGSPAAQSGVLAGDHLVSVDGWSTAGATSDDVAARIRGPVGTDVTLGIERDGAARTVKLKRADVRALGEAQQRAETEVCPGLVAALKGAADNWAALRLDGTDLRAPGGAAVKEPLSIARSTALVSNPLRRWRADFGTFASTAKAEAEVDRVLRLLGPCLRNMWTERSRPDGRLSVSIGIEHTQGHYAPFGALRVRPDQGVELVIDRDPASAPLRFATSRPASSAWAEPLARVAAAARGDFAEIRKGPLYDPGDELGRLIAGVGYQSNTPLFDLPCRIDVDRGTHRYVCGALTKGTPEQVRAVVAELRGRVLPAVGADWVYEWSKDERAHGEAALFLWRPTTRALEETAIVSVIPSKDAVGLTVEWRSTAVGGRLPTAVPENSAKTQVSSSPPSTTGAQPRAAPTKEIRGELIGTFKRDSAVGGRGRLVHEIPVTLSKGAAVHVLVVNKHRAEAPSPDTCVLGTGSGKGLKVIARGAGTPFLHCELRATAPRDGVYTLRVKQPDEKDDLFVAIRGASSSPVLNPAPPVPPGEMGVSINPYPRPPPVSLLPGKRTFFVYGNDYYHPLGPFIELSLEGFLPGATAELAIELTPQNGVHDLAVQVIPSNDVAGIVRVAGPQQPVRVVVNDRGTASLLMVEGVVSPEVVVSGFITASGPEAPGAQHRSARASASPPSAPPKSSAPPPTRADPPSQPSRSATLDDVLKGFDRPIGFAKDRPAIQKGFATFEKPLQLRLSRRTTEYYVNVFVPEGTGEPYVWAKESVCGSKGGSADAVTELGATDGGFHGYAVKPIRPSVAFADPDATVSDIYDICIEVAPNKHGATVAVVVWWRPWHYVIPP